jgi:hypothetical protein
MNRPRIFRTLRISWSVFWGLACVLLIVLWVRSYYRTDRIWRINSVVDTGFESACGTLSYWQRTDVDGASRFPWHHDVSSPVTLAHRFVYTNRAPVFAIVCPTWLPLIVIAPLGAISWVRRFTLRTLLVATTLVALVLGLVVYAARQ